MTHLKYLLALVLCLCTSGGWAAQKADFVRVDKTGRTLSLMAEGSVFKTSPVVLGGNPLGHKRQEGDQRTPEGRYRLDYKKANSRFYKAIHLSYPNLQDAARANAQGVDPGGLIMIHGQRNHLGWLSFLSQRFDWTDGCIAVSNEAMDEIWQAVDPGTPIEILP